MSGTHDAADEFAAGPLSEGVDSEDVSPDEVRKLYSTSQEMEHSANGDQTRALATGMAGSMDQVPGGSVLAALLDLAPFSAYLTQRAYAGSTGDTPQKQVEKYCQQHRWADRVATFFDFLVRVIVVVLVLGTVTVFVLKALLPLPSFN